ncbi:MAG: anthranilate/aminodeoxychorismate synthase component II [Candidatus Lambdaproteobacteria bacterium RIFOXYD1_FULL_56_27]|nr:MAG: anthranilate/aminodeoxychorismate synthase component II [Candidatus Lambdaproteobacteria bacterium RIFOXYC1_FULL_56_13]OGH07175.1 MAG: anthranilate/aminodeoxychorismate synthase component II [Candidatus Lambdaproteobacteria bacterium RIFOXYD1_FULL_56_27]
MKPLKIYMLDNYDSFTFNLVEYFKLLGANVVVYRNDVPVAQVALEKPDLIVISPGPSIPSQAGHLIEVIRTYQGQIPIFGVCLGHQGMIEAFGGELGFLDTPVHGKSSPIRHNGQGIFAGLPDQIEVGRYHSLIGTRIPDCLEVTAQTADGIVMAVAHKSLKAIGVQFHPESILTAKNDQGLKMLRNLLAWVKPA